MVRFTNFKAHKNKVHLGSNELFMSNSEGSTEKIITDSSHYIDDDYSHRYHIECQSTNDNSMLIEEMHKALKDTVLRAKLMNEYTAANLTD